MNIAEYKVPKLLFVKGVFLKDCIPIDDIFEQQLIESLDVEEFVTSYKSLPSIFNNLDTWQKTTNLKCWSCDLGFNTVPVFIPKGIDSLPKGNYNITTYGCFCSFNCAAAYNNLHNVKICKNINVRDMLLFLYRVFEQKTPREILPSPSKYVMKHYGGTVDILEFQKKIYELQGQMKFVE